MIEFTELIEFMAVVGFVEKSIEKGLKEIAILLGFCELLHKKLLFFVNSPRFCAPISAFGVM